MRTGLRFVSDGIWSPRAAVAVAVNEPMRNDTSARQIVVTSFQCQNHLRFFFVISLYLKKVSLKR